MIYVRSATVGSLALAAAWSYERRVTSSATMATSSAEPLPGARLLAFAEEPSCGSEDEVGPRDDDSESAALAKAAVLGSVSVLALCRVSVSVSLSADKSSSLSSLSSLLSSSSSSRRCSDGCGSISTGDRVGGGGDAAGG